MAKTTTKKTNTKGKTVKKTNDYDKYMKLAKNAKTLKEQQMYMDKAMACVKFE